MKRTEPEIGRKPLRKRTRLPDDALPHALKHWIKLQTLIILHDGEFSSGEIAAMIGEDVKLVSGHIRGLYDSGSIEVAGFKMVGNHRKPVYRAIVSPIVSREEYMQMSTEDRHDTTGAYLQSLFVELLASYRGGKMDDDENLAVIWDAFNLDAHGRQELCEHLLQAWERAQEIHASAVNRMAESGEEGTTTVVGLLGFERGRPGKPILGHANSEKDER